MSEPSAASPLVVVVQKGAPAAAVTVAVALAVEHARRRGAVFSDSYGATVLVGARRHLQNAVLLGHHEGNGFGVGNHAGARVVVLAPAPGLLARRPLRRLRSLDDRLVADQVAAAAGAGRVEVAA